MALHISEIGLRLAIGEPGSGGAQGASAAQEQRGDGEATLSPAQMEAIVQASAAEVIRALKRLEER